MHRRTVVKFLVGTAIIAIAPACSAHNRGPKKPARPDLYNCDGCEAVLEANPANLKARAQLAPLDEPGERMILTGRVLAADGSGPVQGVVIYAHHTNSDGIYANGSNETEWGRRHGRLRGWVKTDAEGHYTFETIKPAPYQDRTGPAHIHLFIREPGRRAYYIDDVVFAGEFRVDDTYRKQQELRGGSGIVQLRQSENGAWIAERDILLEMHPR